MAPREARVVRYLSLFSGIGGFEQGISTTIKSKTVCVGYSEIDPYATRIYQHHYPDHKPLGDITKITKANIKALGRIDLVVGGFPCTNLSSMARLRGNFDGLDGPKSGLFYDMVQVLTWVFHYNKSVRFIIENNNSMDKSYKSTITATLEEILSPIYNTKLHITVIDNARFGVQTRKRIIWTNFPLNPEYNGDVQTWKDVLEPVEKSTPCQISDEMITCLNKIYPNADRERMSKTVVKTTGGRYKFHFSRLKGKSRWDIHSRSDTLKPGSKDDRKDYTYPIGKSRPITSGQGGGNNILIDRRYSKTGSEFIIRKFTMIELERLFGFPDNYTQADGKISDSRRMTALGNSIPVFIVSHVLQGFLEL